MDLATAVVIIALLIAAIEVFYYENLRRRYYRETNKEIKKVWESVLKLTRIIKDEHLDTTHDIQQIKTSQRADKKRDKKILKQVAKNDDMVEKTTYY